MAKKNNNYFHMFIEMAEKAIQAAKQLDKNVREYDPEKALKMNAKMHELEHEVDAMKHHLMKELLSEFMTPIEREDIAELVRELDDVVDTIEEIFQLFYMFDIKEMRQPAKDFTELLVKSTMALKACFDELENFRKSEILMNKIVEVNVVEEVADSLFMKSMRELYTTEKDPVLVNCWGIIYDKLEKACDRCEHVADTIESVIMKNS